MFRLAFITSLSILAAVFQGVTMLRLVDLKIPPYIIRGQPVRLECHYDLQGEALYSVKWFKNNQEFFRFLPEDDPPAQVFTQHGIFVDLPRSSDTAVLLHAVDVNSTGEYRCEVSGEAPSFKTVTNSKPMIVVDLPDAEGPQISGVRPRYHINDLVRVNCTSSRSRPAAKLSWYINQEPADDTHLLHYPILLDDDGLQTSMLGLEFRVRQKHFKKGDLKLKCLATIDTLYWRSNEQSLEGDRPQKAPVLESRETFPGSSSGSTFKILSSTNDYTKLYKLVALLLLLIHYSGTTERIVTLIIVQTIPHLNLSFNYSLSLINYYLNFPRIFSSMVNFLKINNDKVIVEERNKPTCHFQLLSTSNKCRIFHT